MFDHFSPFWAKKCGILGKYIVILDEYRSIFWQIQCYFGQIQWYFFLQIQCVFLFGKYCDILRNMFFSFFLQIICYFGQIRWCFWKILWCFLKICVQSVKALLDNEQIPMICNPPLYISEQKSCKKNLGFRMFYKMFRFGQSKLLTNNCFRGFGVVCVFWS